MPQILMIVGAVLILVGMGSIAAGAPDWVLGLSLGATLIQSGTISFVGGIVLIALAMVLSALQELLRKVDTAGAGAARSAPAAIQQAPQPPAQRQPMPEEAPHRQRETAAPVVVEDAPLARRDAPPGISGEQQQQRPRRESSPGFPSDDQMRIRRETPPSYGEEQRQRREMPAPPAEEETPRPRRERGLEQAGEELARLRGDYPPARRREEPLRSPRDTPPLPPLPQVPASDERRRPRSGGDEQGEPFMPRFRPVDPVPGAPARNPASETVVRSGVIGGMAYTLYADGSIEAELAIGTVRFGSIAELQDHVTRTGAESEVDFKESSR